MESLTNENWYSLEELSKMTGYTPDYIRKEVFSSMGKIPQSHLKLGGYHNTQKFYDEYVLKAIKAYQLKEAVCDAYNEGYAKGRCKINYMYGYDIY